MSNISFHVCTLFVVLTLLIHKQPIAANSIQRSNSLESPTLMYEDDRDQLNVLPTSESSFYGPLDDDLALTNVWQRKFRPSYIRAIPVINLRSGVVEMRPYKKRTIPLGLQKALYAHGIIGRRR